MTVIAVPIVTMTSLIAMSTTTETITINRMIDRTDTDDEQVTPITIMIGLKKLIIVIGVSFKSSKVGKHVILVNS